MLLELGAAAGVVALLGAVVGGFVTWRYRRRHSNVPRGWQTDQSVAAELHRRLHRCVDHTRREIAHAAARGAEVDRLVTLADDLDVQARGIDMQLVAASRLTGQARERALRELRFRIIEVEKLAVRIDELSASLRGPQFGAADAGLAGLKDRLDALDEARREAKSIGPDPDIELPEFNRARRSSSRSPAPADRLVAFDPYAPYGSLVDTTLRVVTWNVWGRYGSIEQREADIEDELASVSPDVVGLVESWSSGDTNQPDLVAKRLGHEHRMFVAGMDVDDWSSGLGLVSRWPVVAHEHRYLYGKDGAESGAALFAALDGPRGEVEVFLAATDYPLDASAVRQAQVRQLAAFVRERTQRRGVTIVFGDFNAPPDSDEIRMLTGQCDTAAPGLVFYDAWEIAGDATPGYTWSNSNPLAAVGLYPNRRFDYVFSAWPRANGIGHPIHCERLGVVPPDQPQLSDHYGVLADLRY